jgi:hypothetical protein
MTPHLIALVAFLAFMYANGVYNEAEIPKRVCVLRKKHPNLSAYAISDYQQRAWDSGYHVPNCAFMFIYAIALSAEAYALVSLLSLASLVTISGLLAALKFLPPKETTS